MISQIKNFLRDFDNKILCMKLNFNNKIQVGQHTQLRNSNIFPWVQIGNNCNISGGEVNSYTYFGNYCELPQTKIGKFCSIAAHVKLAAGNHPLKYVSTSPYTYSGIRWSFTQKKLFEEEFYYIDKQEKFLCEIGNDVWIGTDATLVCSSSALHIGDGAVIAAGAVVTKDVPPYAIVAGCPAKIVRYRFSEDMIKQLLTLQWWDKDEEWIKENIALFASPEELLKS